jgi:hypothetical protein
LIRSLPRSLAAAAGLFRLISGAPLEVLCQTPFCARRGEHRYESIGGLIPRGNEPFP